MRLVYNNGMRKIAACRLILLALLLAVSNVALASHTTTHSENELGQCEFCFGQADSKYAVVHSEFCTVFQTGNNGIITGSLTGLVSHDFFQLYQSRAPPFII